MLTNLFNRKIVSVQPQAKLTEVAKQMADHDVGAVLVLKEGKPIGIVTDRDLVIQCIGKGHRADECPVEDVMTSNVQCVRETDGIFDCIRAMKSSAIRRLPVINDQGNAVGVISFGDLLSVLGREFADLVETTTPYFDQEKKAA
ncbi:MAG: CBS domain-containing protein [Bdellovibrionia bacterium]